MLTIASDCTSSQPPRKWLCCKKSPPSHPPTAKSVDVCTSHRHYCFLTLRLSAIASLCHHGSLPSRLSALVALCPAIYFSDATANGRSGTKMSKNARPQLAPPPPLCTHSHAPSTSNQDAPPSTLLPHPRFYIFDSISYKRQHGSACVLARCGIQSSGICVALWPTCVVLSRYLSSPVATGCPSAEGCVYSKDNFIKLAFFVCLFVVIKPENPYFASQSERQRPGKES